VSDEVNELLAELENSDLMKDAKANTSANKDTSKNQAFAGGLFDGLMEGYTGDHEYKADEHKRRSLQILQEEEERGVFNSKEGLTAMLEVFDQVSCKWNICCPAHFRMTHLCMMTCLRAFEGHAVS
jgi:hypothetical protein